MWAGSHNKSAASWIWSELHAPFAMATYGEEVEIFFDTHAGLRPSPASLGITDDTTNSEIHRNDPKADIHPTTLNRDLNDDHANSNLTNIGLGLTFNTGKRYQR